jgi:hypothetical protein
VHPILLPVSVSYHEKSLLRHLPDIQLGFSHDVHTAHMHYQLLQPQPHCYRINPVHQMGDDIS